MSEEDAEAEGAETPTPAEPAPPAELDPLQVLKEHLNALLADIEGIMKHSSSVPSKASDAIWGHGVNAKGIIAKIKELIHL